MRGRGEQDADLVGEKPGATGPVQLQPVVQLLEPILHVAPLAVDPLVDRLGIVGELVTTSRGLFLGSRPGCRTTLP